MRLLLRRRGVRPLSDAPRRRLGRRFLRAAAWALAAFFASTALPVLLLRWVPPPTTAFMIGSRIAAARAGRQGYRVRHRWVPRERIAPAVALAAVAAEDQKFPLHRGFDLDSLRDAVEARERGRRLRGASTITQQTAKNLFLWPGRSWVRKGLEAWFTVLLEALWPKRRILEVYLNVAEFGDGVYGVGAAAEAFFGAPPARLGARQAALLAAVLPSPRRMRPDRPSRYVLERAGWILGQMEQLGGAAYLRGAW